MSDSSQSSTSSDSPRSSPRGSPRDSPRIKVSASPFRSPRKSVDDLRIIFNVSGTLFETTFKTIQASKLLATLVESTESFKKPIFLDEDPDVFKNILGILRSDKFPYPRRYSYALKIYGIDDSHFYAVAPEDATMDLLDEIRQTLDRVYVRVRYKEPST